MPSTLDNWAFRSVSETQRNGSESVEPGFLCAYRKSLSLALFPFVQIPNARRASHLEKFLWETEVSVCWLPFNRGTSDSETSAPTEELAATNLLLGTSTLLLDRYDSEMCHSSLSMPVLLDQNQPPVYPLLSLNYGLQKCYIRKLKAGMTHVKGTTSLSCNIF